MNCVISSDIWLRPNCICCACVVLHFFVEFCLRLALCPYLFANIKTYKNWCPIISILFTLLVLVWSCPLGVTGTQSDAKVGIMVKVLKTQNWKWIVNEHMMSFIHKFVKVDQFFNIQEKQSKREKEKRPVLRAIFQEQSLMHQTHLCLDHKRKQKLFVYVLVRMTDKIVYY